MRHLADDVDFRFELWLGRDPTMVSLVRLFLEKSLERLMEDQADVSRISLAAHELLENASRYGVGEKLEMRFECKAGWARIVLINDTTAHHAERLRRRIGEIGAATIPFDLYQDLIRRCRSSEELGLGLARVAAECDLALALEIEGSAVTVTADYGPARRDRSG